jgi:hypothetical protein
VEKCVKLGIVAAGMTIVPARRRQIGSGGRREAVKMRTFVVAAVLAAGASVAQAGVIESACLKSNRPEASRALCGCIQDAADLTLSRNEQRLAASFFKDPQKAQDVRMSKKDAHNAFWERYKNFGATAAAYCGAGN